MFRIMHSFNFLPQSFPVDKSFQCQPGQIASLSNKNKILMPIFSDGLHPFGIIDDIRTSHCRQNSIEELVKVFVSNKDWELSREAIAVSKKNISLVLENSSIIANSFYSESTFPVIIKAMKGLVIIPKNTTCDLYYDDMHDHFLPYFYFKVSYAYNVPFTELEDSISSSDRITIWTKPLIYETDMFHVDVKYNMHAPLYVANGLLTSCCETAISKCIGKVLKAPSRKSPLLRILWDPENKITDAEIITATS